MAVDSDYARVLEQLSSARLTPYVSYISHDAVNGMGRSSTVSHVVVRVSDGKIISGKTHMIVETDVYKSDNSNPVTHPIFDAACYRATGESPASYDGEPAIEMSLSAICKERASSDHDYPFTTLYVTPQTLRPLDAHADVAPTDDDKSVSLAFDQRFTMAQGRVMPASMKVDISGSGLMFWLQIHVEETYEQYRFLGAAPQ
jgi:hypothetical protein